MFPKTSACVKNHNGQTKCMYFLIEDDDLLEKCNTIWDKFRSDMKKLFDNNFFFWRGGVLLNPAPSSTQLHPPPSSSF